MAALIQQSMEKLLSNMETKKLLMTVGHGNFMAMQVLIIRQDRRAVWKAVPQQVAVEIKNLVQIQKQKETM